MSEVRSCPGPAAELGAKFILYEFFIQRVLHSSSTNNAWTAWGLRALAGIADKVPSRHGVSGIVDLLALPNLLAELGEEMLPDRHGTTALTWQSELQAAFDDAFGEHGACESCWERTSGSEYVIQGSSAARAVCLTPLMKAFEGSREAVDRLAFEWGFTDELGALGANFRLFLGSAPEKGDRWVETWLRDERCTLSFAEGEYTFERHLLLRFLLMHEWASHVLTGRAGPTELLDDFCFPWQNVILTHSLGLRWRECAAANNYVTTRFLSAGWGVGVREVRGAIQDALNEVHHWPQYVSIQMSWVAIAQLSLDAAQLLGADAAERFLRPIERLLDSPSPAGLDGWTRLIAEVTDRDAGISGSDRAGLMRALEAV